MNCNNCNQPFNSHTRTPKLLPSCGHSLCTPCLSSLTDTHLPTFNCPSDNISYPTSQIFNDNLYILSLFQSETTVDVPTEEPCSLHKRRKDIYCSDCGMEICSDCVLFGSHKGHKYDSLTQARERQIVVLKGHLTKFSKIEKKCDFNILEDLGKVMEEKVLLINREFDVLAGTVEERRREAVESVKKTYSGYMQSVTNLRHRVGEIVNSVKSAIGDNNLENFAFLEKKIIEEADQIDRFLMNDIFKGRTEMEKKLIIEFNKNTKKIIEDFCKLEKGKLKKETVKEKEEDLLQESFNDLIKNADSLLHANEVDMNEYNKRLQSTPSNNYMKYIQNKGNYSAISSFSGLSTNKSNNKQKNNGSLLGKKKPSTSSIMSTFSNPMTTTKKPKSLFNTSQNLSNLSKITKNSASPSPFKSERDKENNHKLANKLRPSRTDKIDKMGKIKVLIDKADRQRQTILDLSDMDITDKNMEAIGKLITKATRLKTIKLNNNEITEIGLKYLLKNIKDGFVEYVFVNNNRLKDTALDYFISFRKYNNRLKAVYMSNNPVNRASNRLRVKIRLLEDNNIIVVL